MNHFKTLTLCADDFGLNAGISEGILECLRLQRLSAVSCMTNMPDFNYYSAELIPFKNKIQMGLHLNLTEGFFLSEPDRPCFSLNQLLVKSHLRLLKAEFIMKELSAQLEHYLKFMGELPDFIDGHQHIHQFPLIQSMILKLYEQKLRKKNAWIRSTYPYKAFSPYQFKAQVLALTGGRALKAELVKLKIPHNSYFGGIYDFAATDYRNLFQTWLNILPCGALIMCHPGLGKTDSIASARNLELSYFLSEEFSSDCLQFQVQLT